MKRTIKAITVALAVMLLACSVFAFGASANTEEETNTVDILAQNLYYEDLVSVLYAVDVPLEDAENVTVQYYYASNPDVKYEAVLLDTTNPNYVCTVKLDDNTEVKYPCFRTAGFAAHNFTDVVYAVAYTGDVAPTNPVYKEYSVAEYLYSRLYKDDFINKTEADGDDYTRKMHYENLMAYGETAQMLFDKEETLITDYSFVYFPEKDGILNGITDKTSGLYAKDTSFAVTYTGTANVAGWNVNGGDLIVEGKDATVTATGDLMSFVAVASTATPNIVMNPDSSVDTTIEWAEDPAGERTDNVIHVTDPGTASASDTANNTNWATVGMDVLDETSNVYVFESDIYVPAAQGNGQELVSFTFMAEDGSIVSRFFIGVSGDILRIKETNSSNGTTNNLVATTQGKGDWFTFKIVLTNGETPTVAMYIDGVAIEDADGYLNSYYTANAGKDIADYFQIGFMNYLAVDAYFDNVSFTQGVAAE